MMPIRELQTIFKEARAKGLDGKTFAVKAGLRQETLSRLRQANDCRLSTVKGLAAAVGFELILRPKPPSEPGTAARLAARKLSAGRPRPISAAALIGAIKHEAQATNWSAHLAGLLEEMPIETLHDLVLDGDASFDDLVRLARNLHLEGPTIDWIREMAGNIVGSVAVADTAGA